MIYLGTATLFAPYIPHLKGRGFTVLLVIEGDVNRLIGVVFCEAGLAGRFHEVEAGQIDLG